MQTLTFGKQDRLCSQKQIDELFACSKSFFIYPFKVAFLIFDESSDYTFKVGFTVPKRLFKKAVDRNKLKRRMREAFRLQKEILNDAGIIPVKKCIFMIIYTEKKILEYQIIEAKIKQVLLRLAKEYASTNH